MVTKKETAKKKIILIIFLFFIFLLLIAKGFFFRKSETLIKNEKDNMRLSSRFRSGPILTPTATPTKGPTPTPTISYEGLGPCKRVPILMYHHVNLLSGEQKTSSSLTIRTDVFANQMNELNQKGYTTITIDNLLDFLNGSGALPAKPIVITFDDGYVDFFTDAFPILRTHNFLATIFVSSGLIESGPDYLTWGQLREMKGSGLLTIGNHTWSHKSLVGKSKEVIEYEIRTAQGQIESYAGEKPRVFAYPYGTDNGLIETTLQQEGLRGAVVTYPRLQCAKAPYELGRTRIGSASLSSYGI